MLPRPSEPFSSPRPPRGGPFDDEGGEGARSGERGEGRGERRDLPDNASNHHRNVLTLHAHCMIGQRVPVRVHEYE